MPKLDILQFACRSDNYGVLIHEEHADVTAAIDAPDTESILAKLAEKGWRLTNLLITHHHGDHTAGNLQLKEATGCTVIGPKAEADRIPGIDRGVVEGNTIAFGEYEIRVIETPGHTIGHVTYWIPAASVAFVGDTLFAMGCGRIFEGNAKVMWASLNKLMALPPETEIYCGHEYTAANAAFALTVDPENAVLQKRAKDVTEQRSKGLATLPTRIDLELETNPFLRPHVAAIRQRLGMQLDPDWRVFAEIRERKNRA
jgi:hydroxyacylglutathione hydrolase